MITNRIDRRYVSAMMLLLGLGWAQVCPAEVRVMRVPAGGLQPMVAVDGDGNVHMIYFKGDPNQGNILYMRRLKGQQRFSRPLRVNSGPNSAVAIGTMRGPQLTIGQDGTAHVAWLGSAGAEPRAPGGHMPMLYARLLPGSNRFEKQRNLITFAFGLDGGGTIAADQRGNVYVAWHAGAGEEGEHARQVWVTRSTDNGKTFSKERPATQDNTGACACCGMAGSVGPDGSLYLMYRTARQTVHRDMVLLRASQADRPMQGQLLEPWILNTCPASSAAIFADQNGVLVAWQTREQVAYARIDPTTGSALQPVHAPGLPQARKHPAVAASASRQTVLVWAQVNGWGAPGSIAWQVFDETDQPVGPIEQRDGLPAWSRPAVFPDGDDFVIVY